MSPFPVRSCQMRRPVLGCRWGVVEGLLVGLEVEKRCVPFLILCHSVGQNKPSVSSVSVLFICTLKTCWTNIPLFSPTVRHMTNAKKFYGSHLDCSSRFLFHSRSISTPPRCDRFPLARPDLYGRKALPRKRNASADRGRRSIALLKSWIAAIELVDLQVHTPSHCVGPC